MTHSYREIWAVKGGGGERNLRRHGSPNENLAQTSHGRGAGLQPYKFTGKELETTHGQCLYDFGARWLDPLLPRWTSTDPLAEAYYHVSPYAYCAGNPVSFVDPDGMDYFRTFSGALIWRNTHEESRIEDGVEYYNIGNSYILVNHDQSMIYFFRNNSLVGNWSFSEWNGPLPDAPHWQSTPCGSRDEDFIQGTGRYADGSADFYGDAAKMIAGGGGAFTTGKEHQYYSKELNQWRGKDGKYYEGLKGRGPNQHTGPRSAAKAVANNYKTLGYAFALMGAIPGAVNVLHNPSSSEAWMGFGWDAALGFIGTRFGLYGGIFAAHHSLILPLYANGGRQAVIDGCNDRADMIQRGYPCVGYPNRAYR